MIDLKSIYTSKLQYAFLNNTNFFSKTILIQEIINNATGCKIFWTQRNEIDKLGENDLLLIQNAINSNDIVQAGLKNIVAPYISPIINKYFGNIEYNIRVSGQIKSRWSKKQSKEKRVGNLINNSNIDPDNINSSLITMLESPDKPNCAFVTRPHQDLENNGNRSSHTIIFYFQLTKNSKDSSLLELAPFYDQVGLHPFTDTFGYPNELEETTSESLSWSVPKDLKSGNILIMTPFTTHKSSTTAKIPRVAINVKIQPTNLNYLCNIYGHDLSEINNNNDTMHNLYLLKEIIKKTTKENPIMKFELGIIYLLLNQKDKMRKALRDLFLYDVSDDIIDKVAAGGLLRKQTTLINKEDLNKLNNPKDFVVRYSCADSILRTIY